MHAWSYKVGGAHYLQWFDQDGILTRKLVQEGLTDLGRIGDGSKVTYLTLSLSVSFLKLLQTHFP